MPTITYRPGLFRRILNVLLFRRSLNKPRYLHIPTHTPLMCPGGCSVDMGTPGRLYVPATLIRHLDIPKWLSEVVSHDIHCPVPKYKRDITIGGVRLIGAFPTTPVSAQGIVAFSVDRTEAIRTVP